MRSRHLPLSIDPSGETPLFHRIARSLVDEIRRGRLRPGQPLPGSRPLALSLDVHRNTVLAAYRELEAEGWITSTRGRGTFVSATLPDQKKSTSRAPANADRVGFHLGPLPEQEDPRPTPRPGLLSLRGGVPDVRLAPADLITRAYRRALRVGGASLLAYGDAAGHPSLRRAVAAMLSATRGLPVEARHVVITRGSQMAVYLAAKALIAPGDVVAVEDPGYRPAWEALRQAGARLVPIAVDAHGLRVDTLRALPSPVRAVYVTPHHQYPTTVTLSAGRRLALLEWARAHGAIILEDDYDHEFHYEGRPVLPLAGSDRSGNVLYFGTLSKVLAPGLRAGYVVGPEPVVERIVRHRSFIDIQGDRIVEAALAELLEEGEVQRHIRRMKRVYLARRDTLAREVEASLADVLTFVKPTGGMALWAKVLAKVDVAAWVKNALTRGVVLQNGAHLAFHPRPGAAFLRLGFALLDETELREAVRRMAAALPPRARHTS